MDSCSDADVCVNDLELDRNLKLYEDVESDRTQFSETNNLVKEPLCENGIKISDSTGSLNNGIIDSAILPDKNIENGETSFCKSTEIVSELEMLESEPIEGVAGSSSCFPINGSESKKKEEASLTTITLTNYRCGDPDSGTEDDDTSSTSSSSSSDLDQIFENLHYERSRPRIPIMKTSGELDLDDLPPVEEVNVTVSEDELVKIGEIESVVVQQVIIHSLENTEPLDMESVLFLSPDKPLGRVFEVFLQVLRPSYSVRFNSNNHIQEKGIEVGSDVFYAPNRSDITFYVTVRELESQKGSDASWDHNNEPPVEFLDYSDDEQERAAKKQRFQQKNKRKISDASSSTNDEVAIISPPRQTTPGESSVLAKRILKRKQPTATGGETFHYSRHNSHHLPSTYHSKGGETFHHSRHISHLPPSTSHSNGGETFHHSRHNYHLFPSTSHNNNNNNYQCSQTSVNPQQPIIQPAHFSVQRLSSPMPPSNYHSTPLPVHTPPPPFPHPHFPVHQPNACQRPPPIQLVATYHTPSMFGQLPSIVPVSSTLHPVPVSSTLHPVPVAIHPPLLNNVATVIPGQPIIPTPEHFSQRISQSPSHVATVIPGQPIIPTPDHFSQRISQSPSPALQNPFPPNSFLQSRSPLYINGNLPPNAPLSVQIPPSFSQSPNTINPFERRPFPQPPFIRPPQPNFSHPQWPQSYKNFSNGTGYPRFR